jgi:hypothetical protein
MKTVAIAVVGTASLAASAEAGWLGFVGFAKQSGTNLFVDVFCAVGNSSDKFLNVFNLNASTSVAGGFYQAAGMGSKTWKPDAASFNSTRSSVDSFMTAGCYSGAAYNGEYYASTNTNGDPNFSGTSWNPTPASAAATIIPTLAGWYTGDPTSVDNQAMNLVAVNSGYVRIDSVATTGSGTSGSTVGSAGAIYGIWCAHLCFANSTLSSVYATWTGAASIKDGVTGSTSWQGSTLVIPAPSALALLSLAGIANRRRREG